ncbi:ATP-grasp domain-containing protein [Paenibacillus sp. HB172176]|uniref:ATP-grasp domain-containing protein n=1 Tax=Paenibacillus sp. HB172176 TaxID=2493690 RepID=UPI001438C0EF|nr:ATP-grasp domain-containing protein [Paenibacillus sp. HB172176]
MTIKDFRAGEHATILLTGGRAPATLEMARAFHKEGHRVLVAESARHHLCRVSKAVACSYHVPAPRENRSGYLDALESIAERESVDVLIPTCEEIFYIAQDIERLRSHCVVWACGLEQLRELHNKWSFVKLAERLGLSVPRSEQIRTREEWLALAAEKWLGEGFVLKPAYSRFASRTVFLEAGEASEARRRLLLGRLPALSLHAPWVAQRRVYGRELCTYSLAFEGKLVAHTAYRSKYRVGRGASVYFKAMMHETSRIWVDRLVKELGFTGQIAFDFMEEEDGTLYALECNPRATSGVHLLSGDSRFAQAFLQPSAGEALGFSLKDASSSRAMLAAAMPAAAWSGVRSIRELRNWLDAVRSARDVVFRRQDLRPSVEQLFVMYDAWRTSRKNGLTLAQATTIDIEWNGEE